MEASIKSAEVSISLLRVDGKKMTLSVFNQLRYVRARNVDFCLGFVLLPEKTYLMTSHEKYYIVVAQGQLAKIKERELPDIDSCTPEEKPIVQSWLDKFKEQQLFISM